MRLRTSNWTQTVEQYLREGRTVSGGKGDSTAQAAEAQQASFNQQLMATFQKQFGKQDAINSYLQAKLQPMIDNPTGYSADALTAMRTSATDANSTAYDNAQVALQSKQLQHGGADLPSGVNAEQDMQLSRAEASDEAANQNNITIQDANLKQKNYWSALDALSGVASSDNPLGYASAATSGSGAVASLSQANTAANGPGIGSIIGGLAGGAIGAAGSAGGFKSLFGG